MSGAAATQEEEKKPMDQSAHINLKVKGQVRFFWSSYVLLHRVASDYLLNWKKGSHILGLDYRWFSFSDLKSKQIYIMYWHQGDFFEIYPRIYAKERRIHKRERKKETRKNQRNNRKDSRVSHEIGNEIESQVKCWEEGFWWRKYFTKKKVNGLFWVLCFGNFLQ